MFNKIFKCLLPILFLSLIFSFFSLRRGKRLSNEVQNIFLKTNSTKLLVKDKEKPKNYMEEKYGKSSSCSLTDPIEEIACLSWDAALGRTGDADDFSKVDFEILLAINSIVTIQNTASSARYSRYAKFPIKSFKDLSNKYKTRELLELKQGICGNHQEIMNGVMNFVGIPNRRVGFYYKSENFGRLSHSATEVFIGGKWRFLDITWATVWFEDINKLSSLATLDDLLKNQKNFTKVSNDVDIWFRYQFSSTPFNDPFGYLDKAKHIGLIRNGVGIISFDPLEGMNHIPRYVGNNTPNNDGIKMIWTSKNNKKDQKLIVKVSGFAGCESYGKVLFDQKGNKYPLILGENEITVPNGMLASTRSNPDEVCYLVIDEIKAID